MSTASQTALSGQQLVEIRARQYQNRSLAGADIDITALLDEVERLQRTYTFDTADLKRKNDETRTVTIAEVRRALLGTTDGDEVDDAFEIPAGEISRILHDLAGGAR